MNTPTLKAAAAYFALVFTLGFVLGTLRVTMLVPRLGELMAVMVELPLMLTAAWFICRGVVRHFGVPAAAGPRLAMGAVAFALLTMAEFALSVAVFGLWPWWQWRRQARGRL